MSKKSSKLSPEMWERAVRVVHKYSGGYPSLRACIDSIAPKIACSGWLANSIQGVVLCAICNTAQAWSYGVGSPSIEKQTWVLAQAVTTNGCPVITPVGVETWLINNAVALYGQAQRASGTERGPLLRSVVDSIDSLVQSYPASQLACLARQPNAVVQGIPLAQVRAELANAANPVTCPELNASRRAMVEELLRSFGGNRQNIGLVAQYADHALLAWGAYEEHEVLDLLGERGWRALRSEMGETDGIVGDVHATLFVSSAGQHVLAFRGTVELGDLVTDLTVMPSDQVVEAARMALRIREEYPDVVFVGHSMGGRFAQLARVLTGNAAVIFNAAPAGLPDGVIRSVAAPRAPAAGTVFLHFAHARDAISSINPTSNIVVANAVSSDFELPPESHLLGPLLRGALSLATGYFAQLDVHHNMGMLAQAMQLVRIAHGEEWIDAFDCHQRSRLAVAVATPQIPMETSALGATANSTAPVNEQQPRPSTTSNEGGVANAMPASLEDALRRASALGPSVDLVRAYAWLGQRDQANRTLAQISTEVSVYRIGTQNRRMTRGRRLVSWLAENGRRSDASIYLDYILSAEYRWRVPASNIDLFPFLTARTYQKIDQTDDAMRWARIYLEQYRRPRQFGYLRDRYNQIDAAGSLRIVGAVTEADRILSEIVRRGCTLSPEEAMMVALHGGREWARRAQLTCSRSIGDPILPRLVQGLALRKDIEGAVALLQEHQLTPTRLHGRFGAHGVLALMAYSGQEWRNELTSELGRIQLRVDRMPWRCDRLFMQLAISEVALHHKLTETYLRSLQRERFIGQEIRSGSFLPNQCAYDANLSWQESFWRMENAISHYATHGNTEVAVQIATELDHRIGTLDARLGISYGARVLAGALALDEALRFQAPVEDQSREPISQKPGQGVLAGLQVPVMVRRSPNRIPAIAESGFQTWVAAGIELTLRTYIAQFPDGRFLAARDPPLWFDGQCVAWAKTLFGLVASRSIESLRGNAGELPSKLKALGFEVSEDPAAPRVGAMIAWRDRNYGHVGVVTQIHRDLVTNQIVSITLSEANWGSITEEGARRWAINLEVARREYVTEMYGVAQQIRLPVSNLNRGNYSFMAYVYP